MGVDSLAVSTGLYAAQDLRRTFKACTRLIFCSASTVALVLLLYADTLQQVLQRKAVEMSLKLRTAIRLQCGVCKFSVHPLKGEARRAEARLKSFKLAYTKFVHQTQPRYDAIRSPLHLTYQAEALTARHCRLPVCVACGGSGSPPGLPECVLALGGQPGMMRSKSSAAAGGARSAAATLEVLLHWGSPGVPPKQCALQSVQSIGYLSPSTSTISYLLSTIRSHNESRQHSKAETSAV